MQELPPRSTLFPYTTLFRSQPVDAVLDGVGEDEGPGHEHDAEDHRQGGEREPQLVGHEALERGVQHEEGYPPRVFISSSTSSAVGSYISLTTCPSTRKIARSA